MPALDSRATYSTDSSTSSQPPALPLPFTHRSLPPSPPQVFSRGAKFSLFKPAEEMVYIGLDDESRTKGKAAIDVVGAQSGKSIGSVLQQALLILRWGAPGGVLVKRAAAGSSAEQGAACCKLGCRCD